MRAALAADAVVIPFGGGSNISGSLEAPGDERRTVVSIDLGRLDRVLSIDAGSRLAEVQAGAFGPDLEEQLNAQGWTLGHFPDSFAHSTLGGWIATRSSGMQSDKYGDIADLTRGLRVVTPTGMLVIRPVPSTSTGPSVREMVLGSEGRVGIVTSATVHVHRLPARRVILGYLFPTWAASLAAMRDIAFAEASPSVTRVSDPAETQFSFATKKRSSVVERLKSKALMTFLERRRGFDLEAMCLSFIGYEGSERHVADERRRVRRIVARHGGICIGSGPGALYDQKKFDTPYIRDFLLDRGVLADVSETAAPWSALAPLYRTVTAAAHGAFDELGVSGYVMCHLSHSYHSGACLYFTFAMAPSGRREPLEEYDVVKLAIQQTLRRQRGHAVAPPCGRDRACPLAGAGHLRSRPRDAARPVRRRRPRRQPQPGKDRRSACFRRPRAGRLARASRRSLVAHRGRVGGGRSGGAAAGAAGGSAGAQARTTTVSAPPLVPSPLYGLRTWSVVGESGQERLSGPQQPAPWPVDGWLTAACAGGAGHFAPAPDCECGIHAWHPRKRSARRVLALRRQVAGVVEARGVIELHRDGFRAEHARPFALFLSPGANAALVRRLASAYSVEAVPAGGPGAVVDWCRFRGLGSGGVGGGRVAWSGAAGRAGARGACPAPARSRRAGPGGGAAGGRPRRDRGSGSAHAARAYGRGTAPLGGLYVNCGHKGKRVRAWGGGFAAERRLFGPLRIDVRRPPGLWGRRTSVGRG